MIYHASLRAIERALVVVDLPFEVTNLTQKKHCVLPFEFNEGKRRTCRKIEGGKEIKESIKKILNAGIPWETLV
jgi:3-methyl-2-oxobutanoate hydroxymethyltransferase